MNVTIAEEISHEMMHITLEMVVSDLDCGITLNPVNGIIEIINTNSHGTKSMYACMHISADHAPAE